MIILCSYRYEDERLAEGRFAAFTDKKERKLLASDYRRKKMEICLQKVSQKGTGVRLAFNIYFEVLVTVCTKHI